MNLLSTGGANDGWSRELLLHFFAVGFLSLLDKDAFLMRNRTLAEEERLASR